MFYFRKFKEYLERFPWLKKIISSARHFIKFEMRDIRDSYFSKSLNAKVTPYGFKLVGSSSMHHRAMQLGTFEPEEVEIFIDQFRAADVFVDVGSNIGFYACMARLEGLHVLAVEPLQSNLEYLYANLKANEWSDVEVFPMGLTDKSGIATLFGASSTGASLIGNWAGASKIFQRTIPLSTLDILTGNRFAGKKIFIKIDVEGVEYSVLSGALQLMKTEPKPTWVLEVCLNEYYPGGLNPNFSEVFNLFWKNGYQVRTADKRSKLILPEDVSRWMKSGNSDSGTINYIFQSI